MANKNKYPKYLTNGFKYILNNSVNCNIGTEGAKYLYKAKWKMLK